jgi:hypothetical protein
MRTGSMELYSVAKVVEAKVKKQRKFGGLYSSTHQRLDRFVLAEMRICATIYRDKFAGLEQQLGKELTVEWTQKDERICVHCSKLKLRNCYLVEFIPASQSFLLRYGCGFEKIVDETQLVLLLEENIIHKGSNKKKTRDLVTLAEAEVLSTRNRQQQETSPVGNRVAVERQLKAMADDLVPVEERPVEVRSSEVEVDELTREMELQAKTNMEALKELKLRESVLQLQLLEAKALSQQQEEERLQLEKKKAEEEGLALLQQQETEKALSLQNEKDEAAKQALLAKQEEERLQLEKEKAEEERLAVLQQQDIEKALSLQKMKDEAVKQALLSQQEEERLQLEKGKAEEERLALLQQQETE